MPALAGQHECCSVSSKATTQSATIRVLRILGKASALAVVGWWLHPGDSTS